jgi:signal transduction histidine kinase
MEIQKDQKMYLIHETHFLNKLTLICIVVSSAYIFLYLTMGYKTAVLFNIILLPLYSATFLLTKLKKMRMARYWTISVYIIQIFLFSFIFFSKNTGFHFYFLVIPLVLIFIKDHRFSKVKIIYSTISLLLFLFIEIFSNNFSPMFNLSEIMNRIFYLSTIVTVILGMAAVLYFFLTEKEKLIAEIENAKTYAESLFNFSPCAIYTSDTEEKVIDFNNKAESLTGYTSDELKDRKVLFFQADKLRTKSGKIKTIERYSSEIFDKNGNLTGYIESFIDITERVELEEFKIGIERVIRHDLKTPLNSILGFPAIILSDNSISSEYKDYLRIVLDAGRHMLNLINASQNLYKIENGTYELCKEKTDVMEILKHVEINIEDLQKEKKCPIAIYFNGVLTAPDFEFSINTEKTLFYMILTNLIKNAIEASPRENEITIRISNREKFSLSIHNAGAIPEEIRATFFNKYVTCGKRKGNGLGTYSARIMSEAVGAVLEFTTDKKTGTILTFSLIE